MTAIAIVRLVNARRPPRRPSAARSGCGTAPRRSSATWKARSRPPSRSSARAAAAISAAPARPGPSTASDRQPEVRRPVDEAPRLRVRLVEQDEVAEPPQAELEVAAGLGAEVGQGPAEEPPRPLGLGDRAERAVIVGRQGDVVEVSRLVPRLPERGVRARAGRARLSPGFSARSTDARTTLSVPSLRAQLPCQKA